ncbi:hypothetical protein E5K00_04580 [Hymenobacter aquaticus]|uniref:Uncharacterized protein n=1 Tax=Hymenobacter aquaticus TaxID=1867101 RepID=A0A4Z0Q4H0_9BACT|nr:hypothetical protein [Hymenobacter aquaticus]TGE24494.1 hypothetical protein E5K00_04580 [Hymenobacter aquaticus]
MSTSLTKNCTSQAQLEKIVKGQERKFRWRDDWPQMEQAILTEGAAAIARHQLTHPTTPNPDQGLV